MNPTHLLIVVFGYFAALLAIAWYTSKGAGEHAFYSGERKSLWWVVAFGMVGTSLSGVTFISVPGMVRDKHWNYLQMIFGFVIGYWLITTILLPLYYRLQITSIYSYLNERLGRYSYRSGSALFIISRLLGATVRIFVVLYVIHSFVLQKMGVPFELTSAVVLLMIYLYTLQGGVKTIVWTDTLQTLFMLAALIGTIAYIISDPSMSNWYGRAEDRGMMAIFNWDPLSSRYFFKEFFSGIFMTIVMTGLDQEMMQKNLSVRTLGEAQKNMRVFSIVMMLTNILFLLLGALLWLKLDTLGLAAPSAAMTCFPRWHSNIFHRGLDCCLSWA